MRTNLYLLISFLCFMNQSVHSQTWKAHDPGYPDPNLGCSSISLVNKDVIWAAHSHYSVTDSLYGFFIDSLSRVTRSVDGGETWNNYFVPIGNPAFVANLKAIDENTAWICGIDGGGAGSRVFKTTDGGQTWNHQASASYDPSASWVNFVHFWNKDLGITMGDPRDGEFEIYTTSDGGANWLRLNGDKIPDPVSGEFGYNGDFDVQGNTIWFGTNKGRIYKSKDFGQSWQVFESGLPDGFFTMGENNRGIFGLTDFSSFSTRMRFTRDGGENWADLTTLPEAGAFWVSSVDFVPGSTAIVMTTVNNSLISGLFRTWVSYDDGLNWILLDIGDNIGWVKFIDPETGWGGRQQNLSGPSNLYEYVGGALQKPSSAVWQAYDPGYPLPNLGCSSIDMVSNNVVWAVHSHFSVNDSLYGFFVDDQCRVARTNDGGQSWKTSFVPMGNPAFVANITAIDANTAWLAGIDGGGGGSKIFKTENGGETWTHQTTAAWDPVASWVDFVHFWSPAKGITMGDPRDGEYEIYHTANGGQFWTRVDGSKIPDPIPGEFGYNNDFDVVGNTIWFGTNKGRVYRSVNSGTDWEAFDSGLPDGSFDFGSNMHGIFYYVDFLKFKTTMRISKDGGATWSDLNTIPENGNFRMNSLEFVSGSNVIIMTTINNSITKGLFRTWISKDDGVSWTQIDEGSNVLFMDFINPTSGWGGQPQVLNGPSYLFKYTGNALTGLLDVHPLEAEVSIFPNPTSNAINLNIEGGASGEYQILLNDNQGKLVYKKVIRGSDHINHSIAADHLPSGLYTVNISDAKGSRSIKVVKL